MYRTLLFLFSALSLFAQSSDLVAALASNGSSAVFPINPTHRGADIISMVSTLSAAPYRTPTSEVSIQTAFSGTLSYAPSVLNGMIPFVQSIATGPNQTLFIIAYQGTRNSPQTQYIVVPVEQLLSVVYSTRTIATTGFSVTPPTGMIPYFPINLALRAEDIQNVVATLVGTAPYATPVSSVAIQTTLDGPFYPTITGGFIPDVQSISLASSPNETLLLVNFIGPYNQSASVVVAVDQVEQVIYYPN
jgi:hypothetical protein